jgi:hypothetical protein
LIWRPAYQTLHRAGNYSPRRLRKLPLWSKIWVYETAFPLMGGALTRNIRSDFWFVHRLFLVHVDIAGQKYQSLSSYSIVSGAEILIYISGLYCCFTLQVIQRVISKAEILHSEIHFSIFPSESTHLGSIRRGGFPLQGCF